MTGADLVKWREEMGWTQEQAAAAFAITRRRYQEQENSYTVHASFEMMANVLLGVRQDLVDTIITERIKGIIDRVDALEKPLGRPKKIS